MIKFDNKDTQIVTYDYFTNLKHSSYNSVDIAAKCFGITGREIRHSIRELCLTSSGHYFKIETPKNFKAKKRRGRILAGKIKSI